VISAGICIHPMFTEASVGKFVEAFTGEFDFLDTREGGHFFHISVNQPMNLPAGDSGRPHYLLPASEFALIE